MGYGCERSSVTFDGLAKELADRVMMRVSHAVLLALFITIVRLCSQLAGVLDDRAILILYGTLPRPSLSRRRESNKDSAYTRSPYLYCVACRK